MPISSGHRLGPYEILAPLGSGGMGEVYKARDTRLGREVAIKILRADKPAGPGRIARFLQEARAASALNHPHIITIYDVGVEGGSNFLVMEYVKGRPLDQLIPRNGMPVRDRGEIPQSEWIEATDGSAFDVVPEFSPNGNLLYFQSQRDGSRCIWALRLEPATRRPAGAPFPVYHFHRARQSPSYALSGTVGNAVRGTRWSTPASRERAISG